MVYKNFRQPASGMFGKETLIIANYLTMLHGEDQP